MKNKLEQGFIDSKKLAQMLGYKNAYYFRQLMKKAGIKPVTLSYKKKLYSLKDVNRFLKERGA